MNLVADESVDGPIAQRLRQDGHQVWCVAEMAPGISDGTVLDISNREAAVLLTADRDFGELVYRQGRASHGVVLIRLSGLSAPRKAALIASAIDQHADELPGTFAVITPGAIRIRRPG